jgi:hypothetical protein
MPLQSGSWNANINGNVINLQIGAVGSQGAVNATFQPAANAASGFWDEDSQKLTLCLPSAVAQEVYTGYLFTDSINLLGITGSVIFTLAGFVECFQPGPPFVTPTAKRSVFGWYAQIGVD